MSTGGAAKACIRLHLALLESGVDSYILFKHKTIETPKSSEFKKPQPLIRDRVKKTTFRILDKFGLSFKDKNDERLLKVAEFHPKGLEIISLPFSECDIFNSIQYLEADLIHLHWVANFLDWESFFRKNKKAVVWTLHDQNPFLGYEHYDERFNGIAEDGLPNLRIKSRQELLNARIWLKFKEQTLLNAKNINIVAPSNWLFRESNKSYLFNRFSHHHIQNGFPTGVFKPLDKKFSREVLNIPAKNKVLLFVADHINNQRKGFEYLLRALEQLDCIDDLTTCSIGNPLGVDFPNDLINLGRVEDEKLMAIAYSAADFFVIPSLEDNLPNTMIESLLCGTPVIGFPTGGIMETIENGFNGLLCKGISVSELKTTIDFCLRGSLEFDRNSIALDARVKFNMEKQAKSYIDLYKKILSAV